MHGLCLQRSLPAYQPVSLYKSGEQHSSCGFSPALFAGPRLVTVNTDNTSAGSTCLYLRHSKPGLQNLKPLPHQQVCVPAHLLCSSLLMLPAATRKVTCCSCFWPYRWMRLRTCNQRCRKKQVVCSQLHRSCGRHAQQASFHVSLY